MEKFKKRFTAFLDRPFLSWITVSFIFYFIVETVNQKNIIDGFLFIFRNPIGFAVNLGIVMLTFSAALFIRKRLFNFTLVGILWVIAAIINLILLFQRNTQFNASDVLIFRYGIFITARYLSILHCILIAVGLTVASIGVIYLYRNGYKTNDSPDMKRSGIVVGALVAFVTVLIIIGNISGVLMPRFTNIQEGFRKNGFVYAFGCSIVEKGVDEPENAEENLVESIVSTLPEKDFSNGGRPNVVFVQLESFIDPHEIKDMEFDSDPVPNFNRIAEEYPSGYLTVPVVGGGTANAEFEVLTGMSLEHFGTVEYPYETYADNMTCESMAYNYKALGYKAHAMHNFSAGFYMRNKVFENLGFDTFTSFEYMTDIEYNPIGWAKDKILEKYIMSALDSTEESDFVYAISVQGHGSYPNEFDDTESEFPAKINSEDIAEYREAIEYYVSQVREMDSFVGSLTSTLSEYSEPTVVVFFGDHLPGIQFTEDMMKSGSLYKTKYVIWSNYKIEAQDEDLKAYQLAARVQDILGFSSGMITKFHQTYLEDAHYNRYLQALEYDITEGDMLTYGGKNPFVATEMKYGVENIEIGNAVVVEGDLYISGKNFNEHSCVYINSVRKSTEFLNSGSLMVNASVKDGDVITVAQINYQMPWTYLSKCEEFVYKQK